MGAQKFVGRNVLSLFEVYLVDRVGDSYGAMGLYVIDHGKFFGRGRFGAALKFGTELAKSLKNTEAEGRGV